LAPGDREAEACALPRSVNRALGLVARAPQRAGSMNRSNPVGIPNVRVPPPTFGIAVRRTDWGL